MKTCIASCLDTKGTQKRGTTEENPNSIKLIPVILCIWDFVHKSNFIWSLSGKKKDSITLYDLLLKYYINLNNTFLSMKKNQTETTKVKIQLLIFNLTFGVSLNIKFPLNLPIHKS